MNELLPVDCVFVGGGPAGLAPILAACKRGQLEQLLSAGIIIVERSSSLGDGDLGSYCINSDSLAEAFLSCVHCETDGRLQALRQHSITLEVEQYRGGPVPLELAARFLAVIGTVICEMVQQSAHSAVLLRHEVLWAQVLPNDRWMTRVRCLQTGQERTLFSRSVVLATGASQPRGRLEKEEVCGSPLLPRFAGKLMQSGEVLKSSGLAKVSERLMSVANPKVAIVGGSQSALAAAHCLLHRLPNVAWGEGAITLLYRRELRITYDTAAAAVADGYVEFCPDDICPVSGRVFRLGGFRLESRELVMRARGIGRSTPEPRLKLHRLSSSDDCEGRRCLEEADVIVAALGYRPHGLTILDEEGERVPLLSDTLDMLPLVDGTCRVLDSKRKPLPRLYGIGLGAGFVPSGPLGGEPSFVGQANGLWLWQNDIGALIVSMLLEGQPQTKEEPLRVLDFADALQTVPAA